MSSFIGNVVKKDKETTIKLKAVFTTDERTVVKDGDNTIVDPEAMGVKTYEFSVAKSTMSDKEATQRDLSEIVEFINSNNGDKILNTTDRRYIVGLNRVTGSNGSSYSWEITDSNGYSVSSYINSSGSLDDKPAYDANGSGTMGIKLTITAKKGSEQSSMTINDFAIATYTKDEIFAILNKSSVNKEISYLQGKIRLHVLSENTGSGSNNPHVVYNRLIFNPDTSGNDSNKFTVTLDMNDYANPFIGKIKSPLKAEVTVTGIKDDNDGECIYANKATGLLNTNKLKYSSMIEETDFKPKWNDSTTISTTLDSSYIEKVKTFVYNRMSNNQIHPSASPNMPLFMESQPFKIKGSIKFSIGEELIGTTDLWDNILDKKIRFLSQHIRFEDIANLIQQIFAVSVYGMSSDGNYTLSGAGLTGYYSKTKGTASTISIDSYTNNFFIQTGIISNQASSENEMLGTFMSEYVDRASGVPILQKYGFSSIDALNSGITMYTDYNGVTKESIDGKRGYKIPFTGSSANIDNIEFSILLNGTTDNNIANLNKTSYDGIPEAYRDKYFSDPVNDEEEAFSGSRDVKLTPKINIRVTKINEPTPEESEPEGE